MLEHLPPDGVWSLASPLLSDPVRGVRIRAVSLLAAVPAATQPQPDRARFEQAAEEFVAAQRSNAERPEARTTLANFLAQRGQMVEAEIEYKAALRLSPQYVAAAINLADLYRQLGRDSEEGEIILRSALTAAPREAAVTPCAWAVVNEAQATKFSRLSPRFEKQMNLSLTVRNTRMFMRLRCIPAACVTKPWQC